MDAVFLGAPVVIWIGGVLALYMAWAIGANDVANAMGTSVGSGALLVWQAVIVAGVLEFSGAFSVPFYEMHPALDPIRDSAEFRALIGS